MIRLIILSILFGFVYNLGIQVDTVTEVCNSKPPLNGACELALTIIVSGGFERSSIFLDVALNNGTQIKLNFEILQAGVGVTFQGPGILRNGFTTPGQVAFCPGFGGDTWCSQVCEEPATCTACLGCPATPRQSKPFGKPYCDLTNLAKTLNGIDKPRPIIQCQNSSPKFSTIELCAIPLERGLFGTVGCLTVVDTNDFTQSNSRLLVLLPTNPIGTGVMHVFDNTLTYDFYIVLSDDIEDQIFISPLNNSQAIVVRVEQQRPVNRFNEFELIGFDLNNQIPGVPIMLLPSDDFCFIDNKETCFGPIQENPVNPNLFSTIVTPLSRILWPNPKGTTQIYNPIVQN
ncbi:hypothetical protein LCGC14_1288710, partial [marine sediment metagenome]